MLNNEICNEYFKNSNQFVFDAKMNVIAKSTQKICDLTIKDNYLEIYIFTDNVSFLNGIFTCIWSSL